MSRSGGGLKTAVRRLSVTHSYSSIQFFTFG